MIRLVVASLFLLLGLFVFFTEVVGFFKFKYIMMRIHAAGLGDTLGIMSIAIAVAILIGTPNAIMEAKLHQNAGNEYEEEDRA